MRSALARAAALLLVALALGQPTTSAEATAQIGRIHLTLSSHRMFDAATYTLSVPDGLGKPLAAGASITLTAPEGTEFFDASILFSVQDPTSGEWVVASGADVHPSGRDFTGNEAVITVSAPIAADEPVSVRVNAVGNPGPGRYRWRVSTSAQPEPVRTDGFAITGRGRTRWGVFKQGTDQRSFLLYRAPHRHPGHALLVDLHGCNSTAATEARWSRLAAVAAREDIDVLFPQQTETANGAQCWNWFLPENWTRSGPEPSLIAAMTRSIAQRTGADPNRIYISGISAGGVMSDIMAVTYPDLYAAAVVSAGCEFQGLPCFGGPAVQPPQAAAVLAAAEMGERLRPVPVMVIHGDADPVVPVANAPQVSQMWLSVAAIAAGDPLPQGEVAPTHTRVVSSPGREESVVSDWVRDGRVLVRQWIVHGMAHQWSGAADGGTPLDAAITDPDGPNVTRALVRFLLQHPKPH